MGIIQEINLIDGLENFVDSSGTISTRKPPKLISFMRNGLDGTSVNDSNPEQNVPIFKIPKDDYAFVNIKFQAYNNNSFESGPGGNTNTWFRTVLGEESFKVLSCILNSNHIHTPGSDTWDRWYSVR